MINSSGCRSSGSSSGCRSTPVAVVPVAPVAVARLQWLQEWLSIDRLWLSFQWLSIDSSGCRSTPVAGVDPVAVDPVAAAYHCGWCKKLWCKKITYQEYNIVVVQCWCKKIKFSAGGEYPLGGKSPPANTRNLILASFFLSNVHSYQSCLR